MTTLASHQPDFFPYMGYFYKMFQSDVFVFSDNVQYSKSGRHNYNEILTSNGPHRFTLPIHYRMEDLNQIRIAADTGCIEKMLKTLRQEYRKALHFEEVYPVMEQLLRTAPQSQSLAEFNYRCIVEISERFGLTFGRRFLISSEMGLENRRDARIIEMCKAVGADTYYSGDGAKDYHIEDEYRKNGIRLVYSDFVSCKYLQANRREAPNMSVIDYLMNCGFELPGGWTRK